MRSAITQYKECSSEVATEMKTPPDRSGIKFEVGAQLEARDQHKKWYPATIERIDYEKEQVLIHYRQWSRRHNEWFQWNSPYLRPLERVSLRRQGLSPLQSTPMFVAGTKVLACWTDCRFYPAKILRVNKDDSYTVRFYDGVVRTVKPTKVKPFQRKPRAERSAVGSEGWEEGESEEDGEAKGEGLGEEEEQTKGDEGAQEKGASEGMDETEGGKQERDTPPSSSDPPAKKKLDDDRGSDVNAQSLPADSTLSDSSSPTHINPDVLLERQAHLPTTHKFSREPLYRVIKNQPPPILSIELDHNPFKCPSAGCSKSFRKASLLHYHIKYYHSDQQLDGGGAPEAARRKRSSSEAGDFVFSRRMENQSSSCYQDDTEQSILGNEMKKNGGKEKTGEQERKERKHFLKVKLRKKKKKKKRKSQPDFSQSSFSSGYGSSDDESTDRPPITLKLSHTLVDEGSDWSTLTAESGEDTPCWPVSMETDECEVVRCVCEVDEENDFMIQCESCLCWQHGTCMGLYEDNVPHNYICYYCRQTAGWRHAQRFLSETDWLISGHMFGLSCVKQNYAQVNGSKISHTRQLLAHTYQISQVLSGLQLKISLLHSPSQSDLQLWRLPWRQEEVGRLMSSPKGEPPVCYVSSEHCYQKPGASWEKADEQDGERQITSVKEEAETDEKETKPEDVAQQTFDTTAHLYVPNNLSTKQEGIPYVEISHPTHSASVSECQLNLLDHVESLHQQISTRMDLIERELDVLESWLDHSGELEPPDPLSRLPQLKLRIKQLLSDLCLVRRLSVCH